jgi:hypothetical protein
VTGCSSTSLAYAPTRRGHIRAVDVDVDESHTVTGNSRPAPSSAPTVAEGVIADGP